MEHQDTKLTSMRPRLKELNDNPYFNSNDIERVNEILYNEDEVSFMNYLAANIICQLHKGEKCVYIRYLKNNYVVIKTDSQMYPVIVSKDCLQRE